MRRLFPILMIVAMFSVGVCHSKPAKKSKKAKAAKVQVGKTLPSWSEGCLDIHFINSGRGECCFHILPDGTTLLIDAGEIPTNMGGETAVAQRPNNDVRPYITYAKYIKHFLPKGKSAIDYCNVSHFHIDHMGTVECATETNPIVYRKSGLLALYDEVPYKHIIDRAYPNYVEDDVTPTVVGRLAQDWKRLIEWGEENKKLTAARFAVGEEQVKLVNNSKAYNNFSCLNICANGYVLGKDDTGKTIIRGGKTKKGGNPTSCGFHIRYGKFDYITCGDLTGATQNRVAYYFRDCIGEGKLEAFKAHHHLSKNAWGGQMKECKFCPQVVLNQNFYQKQPDAGLLSYIYGWTKSFFTTNAHPAAIAANPDIFKTMAGYNGHIVLRVLPGGDKFYVYMLDDSDFEYRVKSIHGPYKSK